MFLPILSAILGILAFLPFKFFWIFGLVFLVPLFIFLIKEEKLWRLVLGVFIFRLLFISGTVYQTLEPITLLSVLLIFLGLPISVFVVKKFLNFCSTHFIKNYSFIIHNPLFIILPILFTIFDHLEARYSLLPTYIITAGNSLGSSPFLGLASAGGLITLTFFTALINILIAVFFTQFLASLRGLTRSNLINNRLPRPFGARNDYIIIFAIVIVIILTAWQVSIFQLQKNSEAYQNLKNSLKIAAISVDENFNINQFNQLKSKLENQQIDLIIIPEDIFNNSADISANINFFQNLAKELKTNLVATFDTIQNKKKYNSTVLFNADGEIIALHNKNRLTFVGEYWPFGAWRPFFYDWASKANPAFKNYAVFNPQNAYSRGDKKLLTIEADQTRIQFASLICLEIHYPNDLKEYKKMGARFIINPASNRWLTVGKKHFLYLTNNLKKIESVWLKIPIISSGVNDFAGITSPDGKENLIISHLKSPISSGRFTD